MVRVRPVAVSRKGPVVSGNARDIIGLFESADRSIKMDSDGRITINRLGKTTVRIHVDSDGLLVVSGDNPILIAPGASNLIRIL